MPGVQEVAAVGVPDEMWGEAIRLFVVPSAGAELSVRDLKAYCNANLETVMRPKYFEIVPDLPRTVSGKISKLELKKQG
jgi:long-chain acyl-CoA synthetase